jgi:hypothetical protein
VPSNPIKVSNKNRKLFLNNPKSSPGKPKYQRGIPYQYVKHQKLNLKSHPGLNEKWLQERIAKDPSILGLGELILKD